MKKLLPLVLLFLGIFSVGQLNAQCSSCSVDTTCTALGFCKTSFLVGTAGEVYEDSMAVFIPAQVDPSLFIPGVPAGNIPIQKVTLTSITGLPPGMSYQILNGQTVFTPASSGDARTCFTICGTPQIPGTFKITLNLLGDVDASGLGIPGVGVFKDFPVPPEFTSIDLEINPSTNKFGNIKASPFNSCGSTTLLTDFTAALDFNPNWTRWEWTIDDGAGSTINKYTKSFQQQFTGYGDYGVSLQTIETSFRITSINVTSTNGSNWCDQDLIEEGVTAPVNIGCLPFTNPDLFVELATGEKSSTANNTRSHNFQNLNWFVNQDSISITVWDEDGTNVPIVNTPDPDDVIGILKVFPSFTPQSVNDGNGTSITVTFDTAVKQTFIDSATITLSPPLPPIGIDVQGAAVCGVDTLVATVDSFYRSLNGVASWFLDSVNITQPGNGSNVLSYYQTDMITEGEYILEYLDTFTLCEYTTSYNLVFPPVPVIDYDAPTGFAYVTNNTNGYNVIWTINGVVDSTLTMDSIPFGGTDTAVVTMGWDSLCWQESAPFFFQCIAGAADPISATNLCCTDTTVFRHSGFVFDSTRYQIAWGLTPQSLGPITDTVGVQYLRDSGNVFLGDAMGYVGMEELCEDGFFGGGSVYMTPLVIERPVFDTIVYDSALNCIPSINMCPDIVGTGWSIDTLNITFPNGQTFTKGELIQSITGLPLDIPIDPGLLQLVPGGSLCFDLGSIYNGDPSGTWTISVHNAGTGAVTFSVPDFQVIVYADSCPLLTQNQVINIPSQVVTINPGESKSIVLDLPPPPGDFPTVKPECVAYGTPVMFDVCALSVKEISAFTDLRIYPNPNSGSFNVSLEDARLNALDIRLYDMSGRLVVNEAHLNLGGSLRKEIRMDGLSNGVYMLEISSAFGRHMERIVLRR